MPVQLPFDTTIPTARDVPYAGTIKLEVDARDVARRILRVDQRIPVVGGERLVLRYPMWMPGNHSPRGPLQNLGGLTISAEGERLSWRRDEVDMAAFHVDVPAGVRSLQLSFQFLSPRTAEQGRRVLDRNLLLLQWNWVLLYPAGHYARRISIQPELTLPAGWRWASALKGRERSGRVEFAPASLEELVDSPVFAGRHMRHIPLDDGREPVRLNLFAADAAQIAPSAEQIALHRAIVEQVDRLFGARPFSSYDFLLTLSDDFGSGGTEHQRSSENRADPDYFTNWTGQPWSRILLPHEYIHAWNGKSRRPERTWTADFNVPTRNELLWVYEGLTTYYATVIAARAGLLSREQALDLWALNYAVVQGSAGRSWRSLADTTNSAILSSRRPLPWPDYQRHVDYYEGAALVWLEIDTRIRALTGERRSLDDFMRAFFAGSAGNRPTSTYDLDEVVAGLEAIAPYDWRTLLTQRVSGLGDVSVPDLAESGHRLIFGAQPTDAHARQQAHDRNIDLRFSLGLLLSSEGRVSEVRWNSPAFVAGIAPGMQLLALGEDRFSKEALERALAGRQRLRLTVQDEDAVLTVDLPNSGGRYPRLERAVGRPDRLAAIVAPR